MGHKGVCFTCKKAFSSYRTKMPKICPECSNEIVVYPHRFRPPAKNDLKKWEVVAYLRQHGFLYHYIYEEHEHINENGERRIRSRYVQYPETMRAAKEFVEKYGHISQNLDQSNR